MQGSKTPLTVRLDGLRVAITAGALVFATAAWKLSRITAESGAHDFFWPLILRGVGLGLGPSGRRPGRRVARQRAVPRQHRRAVP